jgi:hypothetical protein
MVSRGLTVRKRSTPVGYSHFVATGLLEDVDRPGDNEAEHQK